MTDPILARIGITADEWTRFRVVCVEKGIRPSQLLAELVRHYLKGRK